MLEESGPRKQVSVLISTEINDLRCIHKLPFTALIFRKNYFILSLVSCRGRLRWAQEDCNGLGTILYTHRLLIYLRKIIILSWCGRKRNFRGEGPGRAI